MVSDEKLEQFLDQQGIAWEITSDQQHFALANQWETIYGSVWRLGLRHTHGVRARQEYSQRSAEAFFIVPFLGDRAGPHGIGKRGPRTAAYECHWDGRLPNLSEFSYLDFFVSPPALNWTMLSTHEDDGLGGPYFIERAWLVPLSQEGEEKGPLKSISHTRHRLA
jgi:hypothetical protein